MKRISLLLSLIFILPLCLISQSEEWPVSAVTKSGKTLPVNIYLEDGTAVPVFAIFRAGNDHFMDVKGVHKGEKISIKLISSKDALVPVKGISKDGDIYKVKAVNENGKILDVKGVSRDGNTLNIAAISPEGKKMPLMAISPEGVERVVKGIKFWGRNVEMEFGDIRIIAHVKALPIIEIGEVDSEWDVIAPTDDKGNMKLVAVNEKGREFPITAEMEGKYPYLMNVNAESRMTIHVKLIKKNNKISITGIDAIGRLYEVKAVAENGETSKVMCGKKMGNVIPIYVPGPDGKKYPLKAISSEGHEFDVKGIKAKEADIEDMISGLNEWIRYFAHVKALAPTQSEKQKQ